MRQNFNSLLLSTIALITISAMNSSAVPIFAVSGMVINSDGILVNGLAVTVENRTRNIIGESVTGETGEGRYDVVFLSFNGVSVGEVGDVLNIIIKMNGQTISEVTHILTAQNINDAHLNFDIQLQVKIPLLAAQPKVNKTDTLGNLKFQLKKPRPQSQNTPKRAALLQNYPNPFNPETWIPYQLSQDSTVIISIYKATGQLVRRLNIGPKAAGMYIIKERAVYWDGKDDYGDKVVSGLYFYTIQIRPVQVRPDKGAFTATRQMVLLR